MAGISPPSQQCPDPAALDSRDRRCGLPPPRSSSPSPSSPRSASRSRCAALAGRSIRAPSGFDVRFDAETQHLHKPVVIGRFDENNVLWPVWISDGLIAPEPWSRWLEKNAERGLRKAG